MKRFLSVLTALSLTLGILGGCGAESKTDWEYISDNGKMIIGITLYEPMNYYDENGELTGFDTEFATAVCEELGIEPVFQVIEWEQKETELKSKTIDCIWNGLTVTEDRKENMAFSEPYVDNKQVLIIKADNVDKYSTLEGLVGIDIGAESGSAGEEAIIQNETLAQDNYIACSAQKDVLMEVKAGTIQAGVIDYVIASSSIKDDTDYSDLMIVDGIELQPEQYAVGLRLEDTETLAKVNQAMEKLADEGKLQELAEKYEMTDVLAFS